MLGQLILGFLFYTINDPTTDTCDLYHIKYRTHKTQNIEYLKIIRPKLIYSSHVWPNNTSRGLRKTFIKEDKI